MLVLDIYLVLNTQNVLHIRASNTNSSSGYFLLFLFSFIFLSIIELRDV